MFGGRSNFEMRAKYGRHAQISHAPRNSSGAPRPPGNVIAHREAYVGFTRRSAGHDTDSGEPHLRAHCCRAAAPADDGGARPAARLARGPADAPSLRARRRVGVRVRHSGERAGARRRRRRRGPPHGPVSHRGMRARASGTGRSPSPVPRGIERNAAIEGCAARANGSANRGLPQPS